MSSNNRVNQFNFYIIFSLGGLTLIITLFIQEAGGTWWGLRPTYSPNIGAIALCEGLEFFMEVLKYFNLF